LALVAQTKPIANLLTLSACPPGRPPGCAPTIDDLNFRFYKDTMSSFSNPHYLYLFEMTNGKKKLAYGQSPEDALNILAMRLSEAELAGIRRDRYTRIKPRELQQVVPQLG
jgi:hypothetical protein